MEQPLWPRTMPEPHEVDRLFAQVFALVGEGIAGATHALLAGDRDAAKELVKRDEVIDKLIGQISTTVQHQLVHGETTPSERREYVAILRMLPDMERNGDLAEHIARRAARGLGAEMSARSRGLVERMGEVTANIWRETADAFAERSSEAAALIDDLDDELDDLHVTLTAELVAGTHAPARGGRDGDGGPLLRALRRPRRQPGPPPGDPRRRRSRAGVRRPRLIRRARPRGRTPASPAPPERRAGLAYPAIPTIGALSGWPPREP